MKAPLVALVAAVFGLAACHLQGSPVMDPGRNCMHCHGPDEAMSWTAAGTVFDSPTAKTTAGVEGATVTITDRAGRSIALTTNAAGNFYTAEGLEAPFTARIERNGGVLEMTTHNPGSCNGCHTDPPENGAPGRLYAP